MDASDTAVKIRPVAPQVSVSDMILALRIYPELISKADWLRHYSLATLSYVVFGEVIFSHICHPNRRSRQVLKGKHAFRLYAHQYWAEYLLKVIDPEAALDQPSAVHPKAEQLARRLAELGAATLAFTTGAGPKSTDQRRRSMRQLTPAE
jgi:hypothetical protein